MWALDARIPVSLVADPAMLATALAGPEPAALLVEAGSLPTALLPGLPTGLPRAEFAPARARHAFGCACCAGRSPVATALDSLFQQRAHGRCAWFTRVVVLAAIAAARAMLAETLREDRLAAARFRLLG